MIALNGRGVSVNGEYKVLVCASFFYFRIPKSQWADRADMLLSAGYNTVDVYFPWNWHELTPGQYRFDGDADVDEFLRICTEKGLMIVARPGPYICSEWDGGALPAWIAAKGKVRSADKAFLSEVKKWYDRILPIVKKYEYNGKGGVILLQLDNELDFFDCPNPDAYVGALRDMALENGISVPLFACAGQLCAPNAGGKTQGVAPTYNFYPNSFDETYDSVMRYYADALGAQDLPLLISETNRDAFLLRREFASGAKLLGAYNQVGGTNFGFTESVNNWGQPLSFLTALYDFWSLVTTLGEYTADIDRQRIFNGFLRAVPEIGAAVPYHGEVKVEASFTAAEQSNALQTPNGGVLVCVSDFSGDGEATVTACGHTVKLSMVKEESIFLPFNLKFGPITVDCANCEPLSFDGRTLVFHTDCAPCAQINGKVLTANGEVDGVKIEFISNEEAAKRLANGKPRFIKDHKVYTLPALEAVKGEIPFSPVKGEACYLDEVGCYRGYGEYSAKVPAGKKVFIENASDVISAYIDGAYAGTKVIGGVCAEYPESKSGEYKFVAEKWGNTNFDDSRLPSMMLSCRKGIAGIYAIESEYTLRQMRFTVPKTFGKFDADRHSEPQTMIGNDKWNTTRIPTLCAYSFETVRTHDKLYLAVGGDNETCVFVNGKSLGGVPYGYIDLTKAAKKGETVTVTVQYRKRNWAESVGALRLLQLSKAKTSMRIAKDTAFDAVAYPEGGKKTALKQGEIALSGFKVKNRVDSYITLTLKDCKATVTAGGRVLARMMGEWEGAPQMAGSERDVFYLPVEYMGDGTVTFLLECVGKHPAVEKIEVTERNG